MGDPREEVRITASQMINNLKAIAERDPRLPVEPEDFNALLQRTKQAFPSSRAIKEMNGFSGGTSMGELMVKITMLHAAIIAEQS